MPAYTVVGVYEDNGQFWVDDVGADTPEEAARLARETNAKQSPWSRIGDLLVLKGSAEVCWVEDCIQEGPAKVIGKGESDGCNCWDCGKRSGRTDT